jgi:Uma2 family endonuclease
MPLPGKKRIYNYTDYLQWDNGERWEIIEGVPYNMTPAPGRIHQEISVEIIRQISNYLKEKKCKVYAAPFDVRLTEKNTKDDNILNVVQPDIAIVCDESKLDEKGCKGSPDLIIEIVSPSNASMDYITKFKLYEKFKVKEFWIVDPTDKIVQIYELKKKEYGKPRVYSENDKAKVGIFKDFSIDLKIVFQEL